jgi:CTP:molybdopterin cytidylyltransferase MocA
VIAGVVLAAGAGTRFGGRKQVAVVEGRPLLAHAVSVLRASPVAERVVVLGADARQIAGEIDFEGVRVVRCPSWSEGQSASLRCGLDAVPDADAVVVLLGDQPWVSARAVAAVIAARRPGADAVRASYGGVPGHPVLLERSLFPALRGLRGDTGARDVLRDATVVEVPCDGLGDPRDVDTPADLG